MASQVNINKYLTREEIKELLQKSNWKATVEVAFTWGVIIATFAVVAIWTNVFTIILALILLGGRQLALAILMHDMTHWSMFTSKKVNMWVAEWLCGAPLLHDAEAYRLYHKEHHDFTGTDKDPDIPLKAPYPASKPSMARKVGRDLSGISGIKANAAVILMHLGYLKYSLGGLAIRLSQKGRSFWQKVKTGAFNLYRPVLANLFIFGIFMLIGQPWLYLLWIGAMITTSMLFARIRSIAEHAVTPDANDPFNNTRTTYAKWYEKLLFAPHNVHYHLEHHMLRTVPSYNLKKMHHLLKCKGVLDNACVAENYGQVFREAVKRKVAAT